MYAAGDIADHDHPVLGHRVRVEHWDNAIEQGKAAARNMLGEDVAYERPPYFFTDQYDLGMEYVGHAPTGTLDSVVRARRPRRASRRFWLWHDDGRVLAAHARQRVGRDRPTCGAASAARSTWPGSRTRRSRCPTWPVSRQLTRRTR